MENEMLERVEQLEEKVKRLGRTCKNDESSKNKYRSDVRGRVTVFGIWCGCSRADYCRCNLDFYLAC